jgi:hypothetical protein
MGRSVADKMGVKEGVRAFFVNAPDSALTAMDLPALAISKARRGTFDYIHLFCVTQAEMDVAFPKLKAYLRASGMLWLSWPKARKLGSDLTLPKVIEIGYRNGLVESITLRIDDTWSAIKFTHPKKGKVYKNKYGTLPDR